MFCIFPLTLPNIGKVLGRRRHATRRGVAASKGSDDPRIRLATSRGGRHNPAMASRKEYLDFILDQLSPAGDVSVRPMMGEFLLYFRGKLFGGIYDDRLLVKPVPAAVALMPGAPRESPYEGGREMLLVERVDDRAFLSSLLEAMFPELPA
jgi:TfoX/Sxy family transcriptional regulator of competence genes